MLLHDFTIGFCVEEQARAEVTASGNDIYTSPERRADLIGREAAPLAAEAGRVIFGDVIFGDADTRFADLTGLILGTVARTREAR